MTTIRSSYEVPFDISTHILTRRMTTCSGKCKKHLIFQLTSSRGGWRSPPSTRQGSGIFQLTSSRGGWRMDYGCWQWNTYFNSHPHEEDDGYGQDMTSQDDISTHILTRRMTMGCFSFRLCGDISTHILTRRMTHIRPFWVWLQVFQLTSSRGGWLQTTPQHLQALHFNSHPHEEDDHFLCDYIIT